MLEIDGAMGEGGGQIVRSALALSLVTGRPFRIEQIRANRRTPGLGRQHLTAVRAAAEIGGAEVEGASPGSRSLTFRPRGVRTGRYRFSTGGAGSAPLVLQAVLPPLLTAEGPTTLELEGGTHNPWAPPFDFLQETFVPLIRRMGPEVDLSLDRPGFYPEGGGRMGVRIDPASVLSGFRLLRRGPVRSVRARALLAHLPRHIGERELRTVGELLELEEGNLDLLEAPESPGPGNAVMVTVESPELTEVFTGFGRKGVPAERVAEGAAREAREYLDSGVPVGRHLADQLLLPLALAGEGALYTLSPTEHARTQARVVSSFLDVEIRFSPVKEGWRMEILG